MVVRGITAGEVESISTPTVNVKSKSNGDKSKFNGDKSKQNDSEKGESKDAHKIQLGEPRNMGSLPGLSGIVLGIKQCEEDLIAFDKNNLLVRLPPSHPREEN